MVLLDFERHIAFIKVEQDRNNKTLRIKNSSLITTKPRFITLKCFNK